MKNFNGMIKDLTKKALNFIIATWKNERRVIALSLFAGLAVTFCVTAAVSTYADYVMSGIENKVIRFHILANSDSEEDQSVKLELRDAIFAEYSEMFEAAENIEQTRDIINQNLPDIKRFSEQFLSARGFDYAVNITLGRESFPERSYGDMVFPKGEYEAVRVIIGSGGGKNFWCVMFPPLCFVDAARSGVSVSSVKKMQMVLGEEDFGIISGASKSAPVEYKVKFKIIELWQKFKLW